jgi:hypothetical protein
MDHFYRFCIKPNRPILSIYFKTIDTSRFNFTNPVASWLFIKLLRILFWQTISSRWQLSNGKQSKFWHKIPYAQSKQKLFFSLAFGQIV